MSVKKILITQQQPKTASPYTAVAEKFGAEFDFRQFFKMDCLLYRRYL